MEANELKTRQKVYLPFKRLISILGSFIGIVLCSVLLWWWVAIINKISSKGGVFFVQKRIGKNDKPFPLIKFRSMRVDVNHEATSTYVDTDSMTTPFGRFLRATSIDETPQLLNIFVGHMSFIGPRPLIDVHEDHETMEIRRKNGAIHLKPGMSGYAQVHGRASVDPMEKGKMDGFYYQHFGFWMDTKLFIRTLFRVFSSEKGK